MTDPRHAHIDRWRRRIYSFDGVEVPSVTSQLKVMASGGLQNWLIRRAVDTSLRMATRSMREVHKQSEPDDRGQRHYSGAVGEIMRELDKPSVAATKGVRVHEAFDSWFSTGSLPTDLPDDEVPYMTQALRFAEEWNVRPMYLEAEVVSEAGYAGSVDWIFDIGGQTVLGDTKTGGLYESAAMQLAAYAHADKLYPRTSDEACASVAGGECKCEWIAMPPVDRMAVLDLKPDSYTLHWVPPIVAGKAWRAFQGALHIGQLKREKNLFTPASRPSDKKEAAA